MPHDPYKALYLHLPFCVKRCAYCDFATAAVPAGAPEIEAYVEDLSLQIRRKAKAVSYTHLTLPTICSV